MRPGHWRAVAVGVALLATSCAGQRNALNTSASPCFRALPAATAAVHRKGRLVGVRQVDTARLAEKVHAAASLDHRRLCGVAFRAEYGPGEVSGADAARTGHYALVLVDDGQRVVAAFVLDELPMRFTHRV